jgi:hypothetical protein
VLIAVTDGLGALVQLEQLHSIATFYYWGIIRQQRFLTHWSQVRVLPGVQIVAHQVAHLAQLKAALITWWWVRSFRDHRSSRRNRYSMGESSFSINSSHSRMRFFASPAATCSPSVVPQKSAPQLSGVLDQRDDIPRAREKPMESPAQGDKSPEALASPAGRTGPRSSYSRSMMAASSGPLRCGAIQRRR